MKPAIRRIIEVDRLIDGSGRPPIEQAALLIEGDRILAAGRRAEIGRPDGAVLIEAEPGTTALPGLIDSHVHLAYSGQTNGRLHKADRAELSYSAMALRAAHHARESLAYGFTALRDMHAPAGTIIDLRRAIDAGDLVGPRIKACGSGLTVTGGHMDQGGWAEHVQFRDLTTPCNGATAFRRGVRTQIKAGADFIKLNTCVSSSKQPGVWWRQEMTNEEIRSACDEAHEQGLIVASHTSGGPPLAASIENGVDSVEHAHFTDDRIIELMVKHGTFLVPTLLVNERNFELSPNGEGIPPGPWSWLQAARDAKWLTLEKARKAGVRIGSGTDAGFRLPHGPMNWRELALLVQGGFTPMEAIVAATATNAELMRIEAGLLQPGRLADILLVAGDPLANLAVLGERTNLSVFKGGRPITRHGRFLDRPALEQAA
jgi:imidazolonepropionase-like amidohydrolase